MKTLKQIFDQSHKIALTSSLLAVLLSIILAATIFIDSSNTLIHRVPNTRLAHQLIVAVNESTSLQKSWVLLGDSEARKQRSALWSSTIPNLLSQIDQQLYSVDDSLYLGKLEELTQLKKTIDEVKRLLVILKDTQWWVDDISSSTGSSPSRVVYYRDVLPLFRNLNNALEGLMYDKNYNSIESHELRISLLTAHHHLSHGLRELGEAIRTGALPHIYSFYRETEKLDEELKRFLKMAGDKGSSKSLLNWVIANYQEYLKLTRKSISSRKAPDANLGVFLYQTETLPISEEINVLLRDLIELESQLIVTGAERINFKVMLFLVIIVIVFSIAFFISFLTTRKATKHYIQGIDSLKTASHEMIAGHLSPVKSKNNFQEVQSLISVFTQMQNAVIDRELQLVDKQKELKQLTHIVTHDMKPPIINIKGHANVIASKISQISWNHDSLEEEIHKLQETIEESLTYINQSTSHIGELVGRILTYEEWESLTLDLKPCDLNLIVENVLAINSHRLKKSDVLVENKLPVIDCDIFAIKTIISTIVDNAIQYSSPSRNLSIEIFYNNLVLFHRLSIKDNGIGIPPELSDSIYLLSGKPSKASSHQALNFGIGLAGVKKLITRAGGKIWHEPNKNTTGTTFHIDIPKQISPRSE